MEEARPERARYRRTALRCGYELRQCGVATIAQPEKARIPVDGFFMPIEAVDQHIQPVAVVSEAQFLVELLDISARVELGLETV